MVDGTEIEGSQGLECKPIQGEQVSSRLLWRPVGESDCGYDNALGSAVSSS